MDAKCRLLISRDLVFKNGEVTLHLLSSMLCRGTNEWTQLKSVPLSWNLTYILHWHVHKYAHMYMVKRTISHCILYSHLGLHSHNSYLGDFCSFLTILPASTIYPFQMILNTHHSSVVSMACLCTSVEAKVFQVL